MTSRLNTCLEALRFLSRSSELEATRLITAELRIREFLGPAASNRIAVKILLEEPDNAVDKEAKVGTGAASFWQGIRDFISQQLAMLDDD